MNRHIDDTQLNDYAEGLVAGEVERELKDHLATCRECSGRLEALTILLSDLAGLPDQATPARDLWSGIQSEIEVARGEGERAAKEAVADEDAAVSIWRGRSVATRRVSFSVAQLVAASVVWALLSGGAVWTVLSSGPSQAVIATSDTGPVGAVDGELGMILPFRQVANSEYEQAVAGLRTILEQGRDRLDPETVAIIETSLTAIDRAIEEAQLALADDPNNQVLNRLLIKHQQSKLRVLRQASAAVQI